jgi:hypothetical protein
MVRTVHRLHQEHHPVWARRHRIQPVATLVESSLRSICFREQGLLEVACLFRQCLAAVAEVCLLYENLHQIVPRSMVHTLRLHRLQLLRRVHHMLSMRRQECRMQTTIMQAMAGDRKRHQSMHVRMTQGTAETRGAVRLAHRLSPCMEHLSWQDMGHLKHTALEVRLSVLDPRIEGISLDDHHQQRCRRGQVVNQGPTGRAILHVHMKPAEVHHLANRPFLAIAAEKRVD